MAIRPLGPRNRLADAGVYYMISWGMRFHPAGMPFHNKLRRFAVPLALFALLLLTGTVGGALHHHQNSTSENTCQICHLNHQPIERPLASDRVPGLEPVGAQPEPEDNEFSPGQLARRIPARAPPAV